ncbi:MAG: WYL domain-containing protein [Oscillospiraceae bacterium]|nr:WYL domain-containing protein [Oscillospiraceae bacterium]
MAKSANQKLKLLRLYQTLLERSDEEHPITIAELIDDLARWDIKAERKSIYSDLEALAELGIDIQCRKGHSSGWFIGQREFELAELKLLVDAVQSSRFVTKRKSDALIGKLEKLASTHQARELQRQVFVNRRAKTANEGIYYNVDNLHTAINRRRQITFKYFDYDIKKERVFRHDGARYRVSPYGLVWNNEFYYLVAFDSQSQEMRHYRLDKMASLSITDDPREKCDDDFNMADYAQKHFSMFSGSEVTMKLRCRSSMVNVILDRFGHDVILIPDGEEHFTVSLPLVMSPQFFGWLFGLADNVQLLAPPQAVDAYQAQIAAVSGLYVGAGASN